MKPFNITQLDKRNTHLKLNSMNKAKKSSILNRIKIQNQYKKSKPEYEKILRDISLEIRNILAKENINPTIKQRVKTFDSYFDKILNLHKEGKKSFKIKDIIGIRIICPFLEDLDLVENLISENFTISNIQRKGDNSSFAEFGYDSIHMQIELSSSVKEKIPYTINACEIQLRTTLQDAWAEIEHELIYKADYSLLHNTIKKKLASLNATLTLSDIIFQEIRDFQKEINHLSDRRRGSLHDKLNLDSNLSILNSLPESKHEQPESSHQINLQPKNQLDKLLFDALDAHGRNEYAKAIKIYTSILNKKPDNHIRSIIYNHRGMAYFTQSQYKKSIKDFSKAIKFGPNNHRAFNNRGNAYKMLNMYENALEDINRSLSINSLQIEGYYSRALLYIDLHDFLNALEDCTKVINIKPDFQPAVRLKTIIQSKIFR
jgi:ppGpp synthetase/RelA/SpoT-type nucleotidyltranferase